MKNLIKTFLMVGLNSMAVTAQQIQINYKATQEVYFQCAQGMGFEEAWLDPEQHVSITGSKTLKGDEGTWAFDLFNRTLKPGAANKMLFDDVSYRFDPKTELPHWMFFIDTGKKEYHAVGLRYHMVAVKSIAIFFLEPYSEHEDIIKGKYILPYAIDTVNAIRYYTREDSMKWGRRLYTSDDRNKILRAHNIERRMVYNRDLLWDSNLEKQAALWATHLADSNILHHSPNRNGIGECCAFSGSNTPSDVKWAIDLYIKEKRHYHGEVISVENFKEFGHYTQVVWKNTTHVGCAEVTGKYGSFVVCQYYPSGNVIGQKPYH
jgi:hypothetical protein